LTVDIQTAIHLFLYVLGCVVIFGILYGVTVFIEGKAPWTSRFMWVVQVALVVLAALVAIGIILQFMGVPVIRSGP
jgi:hypothetical protein